MAPYTLTRNQLAVVEWPLDSRLFLHGPAGTGKSAAGVERLKFLLSRGVSGDSILVLTSQRVLQDPYLAVINSSDAPPGGDAAPMTMSGLAWRVCNLFWPLVSRVAGFGHSDRPPVFLTLETAQYYMAHVIRPLLGQGYFESVTLDRNRLYSQIIDSLNKSATVGFPYTEVGARLDSAWAGDPAQRHVYADVQECATLFRHYCLQHNLLDFSLLLEVFATHLWPNPTVRDYLTRTYRHLIYDNVEEDVPRSHDVIRDWLPEFESALLIFDEGGGYRTFLGANSQTGAALNQLCDEEVSFDQSFVMSEGIARLAGSLADPASPVPDSPLPFNVIFAHFVPEMVDNVAAQVSLLIAGQGVPPSEIVVLAPYLSDALRFAMTSRLEAASIPWRTLRPSRSLRDETASHVLLTLAALAHPHWNIRPSKFDVAYAYMFCFEMDLVRAQMLAEIVYRSRDMSLSSFDRINSDMRDRLTFAFGDRYSALRDWILAYREGTPLPLDHCLRKLFGEVLSQPGFGFHRNIDAARVASSLIDSMHSFREAVEPSFVNLDDPNFDFGREYLNMLEEGVLPAQYLELWKAETDNAVLVAPAYSFLMMNRPAAVQFWLDAGSSAWYEGLVQPLTHPYVLSREWPMGRQWTFADAEQADQEGMARLVSGLLHRCRQRLVLAISNLGGSGFEQRGPMLRTFQRVLQKASADEQT
jgi:hypothetical protein